ncbi:DUF1667 domain-containing protein [Clostridium sp. MCC353]|uniref:DUF1667 domain-containing protein n=1 Tax=Clostridium sp. MCC353 TaxID=2592646 RepID=UPI001C0261A5|nr:DUF1667 domain-containing protein [Clostridium sp. MCC353]MBT9775708.1 DUF1667 domain-containing protein [Clostridium sp. MCC353]
MLKEITCIICPNGCEIEAEVEDGKVLSIKGNLCKKGGDYLIQELNDPRRTIASSILIEGGELPLASVRLTKPIPKKEIMKAMEEIRKIRKAAPVMAGDVVIKGILGTDSDVVVTKTVGVKTEAGKK